MARRSARSRWMMTIMSPDYRPDIMKVLKENGELRFDEVKAANKAVWVKRKPGVSHSLPV